MGDDENYRMRGGVERREIAKLDPVHVAANPVDDEEHLTYKGEPLDATGWDD
jgi:hypothetical protein